MTNYKSYNILLTRKLPELIERDLFDKYNITQNKNDKPYSYKELKAKISNVDILVPCVSDTIDASIIRSAKNLKLIANFGNGVDNIDLITAREKNILVTNTPEVLTDDTSDLVMTLILMLCRKVKSAEQKLHLGHWYGWGPSITNGERVFGKNLGIIGMGRIGKAVAMRAKSFGLKIHYHNRNKLKKSVEKIYEAKFWGDLNEMLKKMDIISIHCPYTPETFHLLSKRRLKLLKKTSIIINTSRGEIIDENALAELLNSKKIHGAGLDVFEHEPQVTPTLLDAPNTVLLPHISSATKQARHAMGLRVLKNIDEFTKNKIPKDLIRNFH
ncbi:MAG: D-glycerate dehydrogenase [Rickettsiales bacterium]|nr:D-glycerate dehydrogenase [Rickettsiales bacterium]OUV54044.1 MAG: D-glycerate dehydrogenase [Rickettsiales bacterium TMED127]